MADNPDDYLDVDKSEYILRAAGQMLFVSKMVLSKGQMDLDECNDWTNESLREVFRGIGGNRPDRSLVSWADVALMLEAVMRRCGEVLEERYE